MIIVYLSNFFNHHQKPVADAFYKMTDGNYWFVETANMSEEQKLLGYPQIRNRPHKMTQRSKR